MKRPRLVDLFCGAGGASMGYHRAGFDVVGVDIKPQPRYPFEFIQDDALGILENVADQVGLVDAIHASPPCQRYSEITRVHGAARVESHPDHLPTVRERLIGAGVPFVIENVRQAPLRSPLVLCGSMFKGVRVRRHRYFEGDVPDWPPFDCNHAEDGVPVYGHTGAGANRGRERRAGRVNGVADWRLAMGIDWMTADELAEAIPPAYTEWIGKRLLEAMA